METQKKTISITIEQARELYKSASSEWKKVLEENFGKSSLILDVCERIKCIEDAFEETGDPRSFRDATEEMETFLQSTYEVAVLAKALNEGQRMNLYDRIYHHYPYWSCNGSPSGFDFVCSFRGYVRAVAGSGSRLSFKEERLSKHAAKIAKDTYRTMLDS